MKEYLLCYEIISLSLCVCVCVSMCVCVGGVIFVLVTIIDKRLSEIKHNNVYDIVDHCLKYHKECELKLRKKIFDDRSGKNVYKSIHFTASVRHLQEKLNGGVIT